QVVRYLGSGGFGDVYRVKDTRLKREVAAKVPRASTYSQESILKFEHEADLGAYLDPHYATWVLDLVPLDASLKEKLFRTSIEPVIGPVLIPITEFVEGEDLDKIIYKIGRGDPEYMQRYDLETRLNLVVEICDALHSAHKKGAIHRDIKPENIRVHYD